MANKAYNYNYRLYLEGKVVPFRSIRVAYTPNGVEGEISMIATKEIIDLKPKTSVHIFYKDWIPSDGKYGWHLMFDGFTSGINKMDSSTEGRGVSITCRDFRMDMRKAPAALAYMGSEQLTVLDKHHAAGLFTTTVIHAFTPKTTNTKKKKGRIETYGDGGLNDLSAAISRMAGTAYGSSRSKGSQGSLIYGETFSNSVKKDIFGYSRGSMALDAIVRGIWTEAVGGVSIASFLNKRMRVDKRFLIPKNQTGFNFFKKQTFGLEVGNVLMGNSRFSSIEAAVMRLAGLFSVRVYSCAAPSLINLEGDGASWLMDPEVKKFLVDDNSKEFGAKYILNETMLLPPLEFTAPPNSNIFLPPMYNDAKWTYDMDADVTRGYFRHVDMITTKDSKTLHGQNSQVPNALFDIYNPYRKRDSKNKLTGAKKDNFGREKPPLTLEERYKGVSVFHGSVEVLMAKIDAAKSWPETTLAQKSAAKLRDRLNRLKEKKSQIEDQTSVEAIENNDNLSEAQKEKIQSALDVAQEKKANKKQKQKGVNKSDNALNRHALLKYLNVKYAGRVATVDMAFNPYVMTGFPGAIVYDNEAYGAQSNKTLIGMVQQVQHTISIEGGSGVAETSVMLNNVRFEDEPTDMDKFGNPLYMTDTVAANAKINPETDEFQKRYFIPDPKPKLKRDLDDYSYDLDEVEDASDYIYVKDIITLTEDDGKKGESNMTYLDDEYLPNRIHKFYKDVFGFNADHFMIGEGEDKNGREIKYAYDTMHEALVKLRGKSDLMNSYEDCIKFVRRNVCSADAFFHGIIGASIDSGEKDKDGNTIFTNKTKGYVDDEIHEEYFGITTDMWDNDDRVGNLKKDSTKKTSGLMTKPGQFSSIKEYMPLTAFIQERRDAVDDYLDSIKDQLHAVKSNSES